MGYFDRELFQLS